MTEAISFAPAGVAEWMPFWKAAGFFCATFILEDLATVGAGLLLASGSFSWPAAFASCFLGIWLGDAGLYALARFAGRAWFERSALRRFSPKVERSETWFAKRGTVILLFSRLIPGARLPTYLAAGFLRIPAARFLLITGVAASIWTFVILFLAQSLGAPVARWLGDYRWGGALLLGAGSLTFVALRFVRRAAASWNSRAVAALFERWRHWEFWPAWLFYPPVAAYAGWLAIKYRGLRLPSVANPCMFSGGFLGESKIATLQKLMETSPEFTADAELLRGETFEERVESLREICRRRQITRPFILKPDVGQRGVGVRIVRLEAQALAYLQQTAAPLMVQRYVPGPLEAGVFYYRFPHESAGRIFAITEKTFPAVIGDGRSTVADLVWGDPRARCLAAKYLERLRGRENEVLPCGHSLRLVETGNHAQGAIFRDGMRLHTPALAERIDAISRRLDGFYIGRYDLRYASEEDLRAGRRFQILELNGAASEATSIYDRRNSLFAAYRTLFQQWDLVFAIGAANQKAGAVSTKWSALFAKWLEFSRHSAGYPGAD